MERKRFIKLIMGQFGVSRNDAREEAEYVQYSLMRAEALNCIAKESGIRFRMKLYGYAGRWQYYAELRKKSEAEFAERTEE